MQRVPVGVVAGGWTAVGVLSFLHALADSRLRQPAASAAGLFAATVGAAWIWAALTAAALWVTRDAVFAPGRWPRDLGIHAIAGGAFVLVSTGLERALIGAAGFGGPGPLARALADLRFETRVLGYLAVVTLAQAAWWHGMYRRRQLLTTELEARLARTHLQLLKMQLQPHFLFNTLNTIAELVHDDPDAADQMITRLGRLLRVSLDHAGHQVVPLRQEVDFLRTYAEIEQVRFQGRLSVAWEIAPDTMDAAVPTLLWQPVLENAVRHGLGPLGGRGRVTIAARREDDDLVLEIRDTGRGLPPGGVAMREGVGLRSIRERLAQLYGDRGRFTLHAAAGGGVVATLRLPYAYCAAVRTPVPAVGLEEIAG